jgi:hypothetical protein
VRGHELHDTTQAPIGDDAGAAPVRENGVLSIRLNQVCGEPCRHGFGIEITCPDGHRPHERHGDVRDRGIPIDEILEGRHVRALTWFPQMLGCRLQLRKRKVDQRHLIVRVFGWWKTVTRHLSRPMQIDRAGTVRIVSPSAAREELG